MGHRPPTITQPAIARALREAKKLGCDRIAIRPDGEVIIYLNESAEETELTNQSSITTQASSDAFYDKYDICL